MNRKARRPRTSIKGTVLFTVVTVMFMLMILVLATLMTATAAQSKAYGRFAENQAYFSARSAVDAAEALAKNSFDFNRDIRNLAEYGTMELEITASSLNIYNDNGPIKVTVKKVKEYETPVDIWIGTEGEGGSVHVDDQKQIEILLTATAKFMGVEETVEKTLLTSTQGAYKLVPSIIPGTPDKIVHDRVPIYSGGGAGATKAINAFNGGTMNHQFATMGGTSIGAGAGDFTVKGNTEYVESVFVNANLSMATAGSGGSVSLFNGNTFNVAGNLTIGNHTLPIDVTGNGSNMYVGGKLDLTARQNGLSLGENAGNSYDLIVGDVIEFGAGSVDVWGKTFIGVDNEVTQTVSHHQVNFKDDVYVNGTINIDANASSFNSLYADLNALFPADNGKKIYADSILINGMSLENAIRGFSDANKAEISNLLVVDNDTENKVGGYNGGTLTKTLTLANGETIELETEYSANVPYYKKDSNGQIISDPSASGEAAIFPNNGIPPQVMSAAEYSGIDVASIPNTVLDLTSTTGGGNDYKTLDPSKTAGVINPSLLQSVQNGGLYIGPSTDGSNVYNIVLDSGTYSGSIFVEEGVKVNFFVKDGNNDVTLNDRFIIAYGKMGEAAGLSPTDRNIDNGNTIIIDNRKDKVDGAVTPSQVNIYSDSTGTFRFNNGSMLQGYMYAPRGTVDMAASGAKLNYEYHGSGFGSDVYKAQNWDTSVIGSLVCNNVVSQNTNGAIFVNPSSGGGGGGGGTGDIIGWEDVEYIVPGTPADEVLLPQELENYNVEITRSSWVSFYDHS